MRQGNEFGEEFGDGQVGVPVVEIECGHGQGHDRTENGTVDELEGAALHEAEGEAEKVVDRVGILAQLVEVLHARAVFDDEVERLLGEYLHHLDEARLEFGLRAVDVNQNAAQVEEARQVVHSVEVYNLCKKK